MLRSFTAIILIATLLISSLTRWFVYAGFELNRGYIAEKLCENRDKPMMHCNGKCYLAKKIKQAEEKEKKQDRDMQKNMFQEAFLPGNAEIKFIPHVLIISMFPHRTFYLSDSASVIYHPPKQIA